MKAMMRWLWIVVLVFGVVSLVCGVILTAAGVAMPKQVVDKIKDENIPVFTYNASNPQDNYVDFHYDNPIDTAADISSTCDALNDALNAMHPPADMLVGYNYTMIQAVVNQTTGVITYYSIPVTTTGPAAAYATGIRAVKKDQDYVNTMAMKTGLDLANSAIKTAPLYLFAGIALLLVGIAMIAIGLVLFGMGKGMTQMGNGLSAIMGKRGPPPAAK